MAFGMQHGGITIATLVPDRHMLYSMLMISQSLSSKSKYLREYGKLGRFKIVRAN